MTRSGSQPKVRILVVDDHPLVREGYAQLINQQKDLEYCGGADSMAEGLKEVDATSPDLVVVDIALKDGNGLELIRRLKARDASMRMLVASAHDEVLFAERSLHAGAMGYINKQEAVERFIEAIRQVIAGKVYLSSSMTDRVLHRAVGTTDEAGGSPIDRLSDREIEIFELIGKGLTTAGIAARLHLSPKTVESHRANIKTKLNLASGSELTRLAVQWVLEGSHSS